MLDPFSIGVKYDTDKIKMELLPLRELREVARVLTYGSKKYAPENWKKVSGLKDRYAGALLRHFTEYREGNFFDIETGPDPLRHIAQVACNALFLLWYELEEENQAKLMEKLREDYLEKESKENDGKQEGKG
jgi:hypothetical protein